MKILLFYGVLVSDWANALGSRRVFCMNESMNVAVPSDAIDSSEE